MLALLRKSPSEVLATVNVVVDVQVLDDALQVRFQEGESTVTRSKRSAQVLLHWQSCNMKLPCSWKHVAIDTGRRMWTSQLCPMS